MKKGLLPALGLAVFLLLLLPGPGSEVYSLFSPPGGDGGSGCFECGELIIIYPDGTESAFPTCTSAPFASPSSGKDCEVKADQSGCEIRNFCFFA